jgi:flagellar motor component MotA
MVMEVNAGFEKEMGMVKERMEFLIKLSMKARRYGLLKLEDDSKNLLKEDCKIPRFLDLVVLSRALTLIVDGNDQAFVRGILTNYLSSLEDARKDIPESSAKEVATNRLLRVLFKMDLEGILSFQDGDSPGALNFKMASCVPLEWGDALISEEGMDLLVAEQLDKFV